MRLRKATIEGFKSVKGREDLVVDPKVTILIGANDHGKSNILEAFRRLNDDSPITEEDRHWDLEGGTPKITWYFDCDASTMEKLQVLELKAEPSEADGPKGDGTTATPECFELNQSGQIVLSKELGGGLVVVSVPLKIPVTNAPQVLELKPRVELFQPPEISMKDDTTLEELSQPEFEYMQGIFRLAGIWDERETIFVENAKSSMRLDEASKRLTKVLNDEWNQGKDNHGKELEWKLDHREGGKIKIEIKDPAISSQYTRPSLRSSGFRTYFLVSMIIYARVEAHPSNSNLYLFDEPGTNLHPRAQIDLQRSFESIADQAQIVYSTHSLFLTNKNYPDRNMVVAKTSEGTKINSKPFTRNWKAVRDSLGILLTNNFLISDKTVLVEGPSDEIYLYYAIRQLKKSGAVDIDLDDFSVVDAGDSSNFAAMAKLMLDEGRSVVAMVDGDLGGQRIRSRLEKICKPKIASKELEFIELPKDKSSEDVFCVQEVLQEVIKKSTQDLVEIGARKLKDGLNLDTAVSAIKPKPNTTLGRVIEDESKSWFDDEEMVSKVTIALRYEDDAQDVKMSSEATKLVNELKMKLGIRGEKSHEEGVFEEV